MSIITLADARTQLHKASGADDATIQSYIDGTAATVENYLRRVVEQRTITERRSLDGAGTFRLWRRPVVSVTSVTSLDGTITLDVSPTGMDVNPNTGRVVIFPGALIPCGRFIVVYVAGETPVRQNYQLGNLIILQHNWELHRGQVGATRSSADDTYDPRSGFFVPRRAREVLGPRLPQVG